MPLGKRIVIIGGELVGLELAEYLSRRRRRVMVIDDAPKFGAGSPGRAALAYVHGPGGVGCDSCAASPRHFDR